MKQDKRNINAMNMAELRKMADTKKLRDIFQDYIEHEKIPSVRIAWIEYFLEIKNKKIILIKR